MKLKNTPEQIQVLVESLKPIRPQLFTYASENPKYNAQLNLTGRTHYVEDDTLRWHKARITSSGPLGDSKGLLFRITESVALNMHNTKRGFRCVVFDVFGTVVYHPDLQNTFSTSAAAQTACNATEFDLVAHYADAIKSKLHYADEAARNLREVTLNLTALKGGYLKTETAVV